jgi:hypothetical protein
MLPACRTADETFAIPQFALTRSDIDSFMDELRGFHTAFRACFARQEPRDQFFNYSLSHMTLHFCYDLIVLGLYSSGSSISSCQYRSSSSRIAAIAAWHVAGVTLANPSSRWTRSPAIV